MLGVWEEEVNSACGGECWVKQHKETVMLHSQEVYGPRCAVNHSQTTNSRCPPFSSVYMTANQFYQCSSLSSLQGLGTASRSGFRPPLLAWSTQISSARCIHTCLFWYSRSHSLTFKPSDFVFFYFAFSWKYFKNFFPSVHYQSYPQLYVPRPSENTSFLPPDKDSDQRILVFNVYIYKHANFYCIFFTLT